MKKEKKRVYKAELVNREKKILLFLDIIKTIYLIKLTGECYLIMFFSANKLK